VHTTCRLSIDTLLLFIGDIVTFWMVFTPVVYACSSPTNSTLPMPAAPVFRTTIVVVVAPVHDCTVIVMFTPTVAQLRPWNANPITPCCVNDSVIDALARMMTQLSLFGTSVLACVLADVDTACTHK